MRNRIATKTDGTGFGTCARPENTRPVSVVHTASREEYATIITGGAGVARALRRSTG